MDVITMQKPAASEPAEGGSSLRLFADSRDQRQYYAAPGHEAVLADLQEIVESGHQTFAAVSGESGSGKTYLRTVFHNRLDPGRFVRISIESSLLDFDALLLELISQINGRRALPGDWPDRYSRLAELKRLLAQQVIRTNRHLVVLVDEAHGLTPDTLEGLRLLSNISTGQREIMTFVLFGAPALELALRDLPELSRRIGRTMVMQPLDANGVRAYATQQAGHAAVLEFSADTWAALHQISGGLPGRINGIMRQALRTAAESEITDEVLSGVLRAEASSGVDTGLAGLAEWIR